MICRANQWTGFYMITASVMKELIVKVKLGNDPKENNPMISKDCIKDSIFPKNNEYIRYCLIRYSC